MERAIGDKKFDVVFISMMLHQNSEENIGKILENAAHYSSRYVVIFDAVDYDPDAPNRLTFPEDLYPRDRPFSLKVLVKDLQDNGNGVEEIFRYKNGRCRDIVLNLGNSAVAEAFKV